ncbi:MAG: hypothetical protein C0519_11190 [Hyphomicrobium sp.]|nr:hypothetical protein [Hyphomicrobium sp.]PPD06340.1 MAG: hypothetical protein CTY28_13820 [Hyphomicrobium sp.]
MRAGATNLVALAAAALVAATAYATEIPTTGTEFDTSTGYRTSRYRAPLPEWAPGSTRIFAADLPALINDQKAILLDVMAAEGGGYDPATGEWRLTKVHDTIPGAIWLPEVGRGRIDPRIERYFRDTLARLTAGDKSRAIIIFCQSDCWMSWNAVRRAALLGYQHIYWLPEGIDGWRDWDGPTIRADPQPVP